MLAADGGTRARRHPTGLPARRNTAKMFLGLAASGGLLGVDTRWSALRFVSCSGWARNLSLLGPTVNVLIYPRPRRLQAAWGRFF